MSSQQDTTGESPIAICSCGPSLSPFFSSATRLSFAFGSHRIIFLAFQEIYVKRIGIKCQLCSSTVNLSYRFVETVCRLSHEIERPLTDMAVPVREQRYGLSLFIHFYCACSGGAYYRSYLLPRAVAKCSGGYAYEETSQRTTIPRAIARP